MKSIGIDITRSGIAIVEVNADRNFYEIISGDYIVLNPNDESNWELDLIQHLKSLTEMFDFKNSRVCVGLSQSAVSSRNVQFPFTRRLDIMKSLPFELDEELPFNVDDSIVDGKIVAQNSSQTSLLAFAAPKEEVQRWIELFDRVDINPDIVSVEGSAFANLFENWASGSFLPSAPDTIPAPLTVRVLFRHESTLLTAFHDNQMVWARNISWGEKNIVLEIMKNYNYPYEQATQLIPDQVMLQLVDSANAEENKMHQTIENPLADFIHTLNLSLIDIKDRFNTQIESVYLLGNISQIPNINAFMTKYIGLSINTETMSQNVFQPRQISKVSAIAENIPIAVGLALEGLKLPKNPAINFRQKEFAKNNQFLADMWSKWGHALTLCAIAYVFFIVYGIVRENIAVNLDTTSSEALTKSAATIANLSGREASASNIAKYLKTEEEKAKNAKVFKKVQDIEPAMKVVSTLSSLLPNNQNNNYDIRRLDVKNSVVIIEGQAASPQTVTLIEKKLAGLATNPNIKMKSTLTDTKGYVFAFKLTLKETL